MPQLFSSAQNFSCCNEENIRDLYDKRSTVYAQLVPTSNKIEEWNNIRRMEKEGNEVLRKKLINARKRDLNILKEEPIRQKQPTYHKYVQTRTRL